MTEQFTLPEKPYPKEHSEGLTGYSKGSTNSIWPQTNWCWKCEKSQEEVWADYGMCDCCRDHYLRSERELEAIMRGVPNQAKYAPWDGVWVKL